MSHVTDNSELSRFELTEEGHTAFAEYHRQGGLVIVSHVEAPQELRGKGTSGRLMAGVVAAARSEGHKIRPTCSFAAAWFQRHKDAADVLG